MKRKSSNEQPRNSHSYFQTSLEYIIGEIKFALRILAVNVDDFTFPASTAKGGWSGHLDNHYSAFGRKKNPKKKCHGKVRTFSFFLLTHKASLSLFQHIVQFCSCL